MCGVWCRSTTHTRAHTPLGRCNYRGTRRGTKALKNTVLPKAPTFTAESLRLVTVRTTPGGTSDAYDTVTPPFRALTQPLPPATREWNSAIHPPPPSFECWGGGRPSNTPALSPSIFPRLLRAWGVRGKNVPLELFFFFVREAQKLLQRELSSFQLKKKMFKLISAELATRARQTMLAKFL